jgi:hypothetical protein
MRIYGTAGPVPRTGWVFNNYKPGASHQTRVDKQMSNPRFNNAVAEIILSCHVDTLEKYRRVLDEIPGQTNGYTRVAAKP